MMATSDLRIIARFASEVAILKMLATTNNHHIQHLHAAVAGIASLAVVSVYAGLPLTMLGTNSEYLADYIIQTCEGLAAAQKIDMCHGDLHPGNLVVREDNNYLTIVDWELAVKHNGECRNVTGALAFASNRILTHLPAINSYKYLFHDDLESLAYHK